MQPSITVKAAPLNYYTKSNAISRKGEKETNKNKYEKKKRSGAVYMRRINVYGSKSDVGERQTLISFFFFCSLLRLSSHFKNSGKISTVGLHSSTGGPQYGGVILLLPFRGQPNRI